MFLLEKLEMITLVCGLAAGIAAAWLGARLLPVAAICCGVVFVLELFLC